MPNICEIEGCVKPVRARAMCNTHLNRYYKTGRTDITKAERGAPMAFAVQVAASTTDSCIEWPYAKNRMGYGVLRAAGRNHLAHRFILSLVSPPPDETHHAAHLPVVCHNSACVNPRHLSWETPMANTHHKYIDQTMLKGEQMNTAKLTRLDVAAIISTPLGVKAASEFFGVSTSQIKRIRNGQSWGWVHQHPRARPN